MDLAGLKAATADLLLGASCVGCRRPGPTLCTRCEHALAGLPFPTAPDPCPVGLPAVWAVAHYDDVVRAALVAHKEEGHLALARPLGRALAVSVLGLLASSDTAPEPVHLVPVPSRRASVRERGHDPLLRMTREARRALLRSGVVARVATVLAVSRRVVDQSGLGAAERAANLAGAFSARGSAAPGSWIVVDDIVTTGATAVEAVRALRSHGFDEPGVAVVAATRRRTRPAR